MITDTGADNAYNAYTAFQLKNGHGYQLATTSLSPDLQTFLMEVMRIAEEHSTAAPAS